MPIDPALAETLRVVAEEGTLDAAARRLVMTPSAVSQRLKLLEQQLGQRLLVRARPVRLTEPGRVVVRFARSHALIEQEARAELGLEAQGEHPRIGIAVNSDSLATWFMPALARFGLHHDAQLELQREDQDGSRDSAPCLWEAWSMSRSPPPPGIDDGRGPTHSPAHPDPRYSPARRASTTTPMTICRPPGCEDRA